MLKGNRARYALAAIRLLNGSLALFAPKKLLAMLRVDPEQNGAAIYALRLFGVRTVFLGVQLFVLEDDALGKALREAIVIHATDTVSAGTVWLAGELPEKSGIMTTAISALNTVLAISADREFVKHAG